jgi:exopolysaccharide biosynthesis WecB/TagA/CpsF family protein
MASNHPSLSLLGVHFACVTESEALTTAEALYERSDPASVAFVNVNGVNLADGDPHYRAVLNRADLVLNDGKGVMLGARLLGRRFPTDLNGNVFTPLLLRRAEMRKWPTFMLGAAPGVADRAAERLRRDMPALEIVGTHDGYFSRDRDAEIAHTVADSGAGLLLVALGNPAQEVWIDRHLQATGARLAVGVGGFFDFQAGRVRRAPRWMRRTGLEWVHRLALEPRRMWRRYLLGNPRFVVRVLQQRRRGGTTDD